MFISPPTFVGLEECAVLLSAVAQVYDLAATEVVAGMRAPVGVCRLRQAQA